MILKTLDQSLMSEVQGQLSLAVGSPPYLCSTIRPSLCAAPVTMLQLGQQFKLKETLPCSPSFILHIHKLQDSLISEDQDSAFVSLFLSGIFHLNTIDIWGHPFL